MFPLLVCTLLMFTLSVHPPHFYSFSCLALVFKKIFSPFFCKIFVFLFSRFFFILCSHLCETPLVFLLLSVSSFFVLWPFSILPFRTNISCFPNKISFSHISQFFFWISSRSSFFHFHFLIFWTSEKMCFLILFVRKNFFFFSNGQNKKLKFFQIPSLAIFYVFQRNSCFSKKSPFLRKPHSISTCVEDRVRDRRLSWPLLRVETWLTWLKQSSLCAFSCHWSRPRDIRCLCVFFFLNQNRLHVKKYCFLKFLSLTLSIIYQLFLCFFFKKNSLPSIVLQKKSIAESHFFSLFISLFFIFIFLLLFFCSLCLAKEIWWQRTRHVAKRIERKQWWEWPPRSEKEVSCWRDLSMTEGLSWWTRINQGKCVGFSV